MFSFLIFIFLSDILLSDMAAGFVPFPAHPGKISILYWVYYIKHVKKNSSKGSFKNVQITFENQLEKGYTHTHWLHSVKGVIC